MSNQAGQRGRVSRPSSALVTGGAGFIGSNLVRALSALGCHVSVLDNLLSGHRANLDGVEGIRFIEGDVRDPAAVAEAMRGASVVFHLAASVGNKRSLERPVEDAEINVIGTLRILEEARRRRVEKVVISSSAGIFGEPKSLPTREDHPVEPDSPYGCTKLCEEKLGLSYGKLYGMEVVCLRYFNVYGPRQRFDAYGNVIPIFVFGIVEGRPLTVFGDGQQTRDFVNVADVVQANLGAALADGVSGVFNIGSGTQLTINALLELLEKMTERMPTVYYRPPRPGDVRHSLADVGAARAALGYQPRVAIADGLREYLTWAQGEVEQT